MKVSLFLPPNIDSPNIVTDMTSSLFFVYTNRYPKRHILNFYRSIQVSILLSVCNVWEAVFLVAVRHSIFCIDHSLFNHSHNWWIYRIFSTYFLTVKSITAVPSLPRATFRPLRFNFCRINSCCWIIGCYHLKSWKILPNFFSKGLFSSTISQW